MGLLPIFRHIPSYIFPLSGGQNKLNIWKKKKNSPALKFEQKHPGLKIWTKTPRETAVISGF